MRISNPDYLHGPVSFKFITVKKLKELLDQVPDNYLVNAQSIAQTGNIEIYPDLECATPTIIIDFGDEQIEYYGEKGEGV